ncbi:DUF401 family protein [Chloroflexota bacterium]
MIPSSVALLLSICLIIILIRFRVITGLAILFGGLVLAISVLPLSDIPGLLLETLTSYQTLQLLLIIVCALMLSRLLEIKGGLTKLAQTLESIGPRIAMTVTPSVIGLVPMPAGALVSATALKDLVSRIGLKPAQATFINYWFRHIWEFSLPVYPSIIATSIILNVPLSTVVITFLPMLVLAGLVGIASVFLIFRSKQATNTTKVKRVTVLLQLLVSAWPILLIVVLVLAGVAVWIAFPVTLVAAMIQQKARWPEIRSSLRFGFEPKILVLLLSIMLYKTVIETAGSASALIADLEILRLPLVFIVALLPFIIGLAAGLSMAFVGITFPLLATSIGQGADVNHFAMLLAYASGEIGLLLSPVHLCLTLSTEYFKARLFDVYRYIIPSVVLLEIIAIILFLIFS